MSCILVGFIWKSKPYWNYFERESLPSLRAKKISNVEISPLVFFFILSSAPKPRLPHACVRRIFIAARSTTFSLLAWSFAIFRRRFKGSLGLGRLLKSCSSWLVSFWSFFKKRHHAITCWSCFHGWFSTFFKKLFIMVGVDFEKFSGLSRTTTQSANLTFFAR